MTTTASHTWASRISDLREKGGMTLAEIGERIGLSASSVSDIECGRTVEPKGMPAVELYELHRSKLSDLIKRTRRA